MKSILLLVWLGAPLALQSASPFGVTVWTVDDGLPQNIVRGLHQTPDGYLWIATLDGLARFDGVRFTVFDKNTTPESGRPLTPRVPRPPSIATARARCGSSASSGGRSPRSRHLVALPQPTATSIPTRFFQCIILPLPRAAGPLLGSVGSRAAPTFLSVPCRA